VGGAATDHGSTDPNDLQQTDGDHPA